MNTFWKSNELCITCKRTKVLERVSSSFENLQWLGVNLNLKRKLKSVIFPCCICLQKTSAQHGCQLHEMFDI